MPEAKVSAGIEEWAFNMLQKAMRNEAFPKADRATFYKHIGYLGVAYLDDTPIHSRAIERAMRRLSPAQRVALELTK